MVGASFSSAGPSQNRSKNGFKRRWLKKSMKTASGTILGSAVFIPARFLIDFGAPLGSQNYRVWPTFWRRSRLFGQFSGHLWFFFARRCLEKVLGPIWKCPGNAPRQDFRRILDNSPRRFDCSCRPRFIPTPSQSSCKFQAS